MSWFELYVRGIALVLIIVFCITILSAITINSEGGVIWTVKILWSISRSYLPGQAGCY